MKPTPGSGPNVKDSVVSGDLHTGDVIHNHYHISQPPPAVPQRPPVPNPPPVPQRPPVPPRAVNPSQPPRNQQQQYNQQQYQQQPQAVSQNQFTNFYQQHGSRYLQNPSQKDVLVTYLLWFFLGPLGGHRFYLNQIGMGVFYFLTFGGCGLLWLIDIALIPDLVNRANRIHVRN